MTFATNRSPLLDGPRSQQGPIDMAEIISAMSFALDLTEGATPGHALRSCILGMRIAAHAGLAEHQLSDLYYALLLKDIGCSSNAARMCQITGGDDRAIKSGVKLEDWTKPHKPKLSTLQFLWSNVLPGASPVERAVRIAKIALTQHQNNEEMITLRCDRGASIVAKIGLGQATAEAVRALDEHWDGSGYPGRRRGEQIPILARIAAVAQHLDVFASATSPDKALAVLEERGGKWFDPDLVRIAVSLHNGRTLWKDCLPSTSETEIQSLAMALEPGRTAHLGADRIDRVCEAFADVVDAKSPFTFRHSMGVADATVMIAETLGLSPDQIQFLRRAALLHDLGKLAISNSILDKQGKLTAEEFTAVKEHPALTRQILDRVPAFRTMAEVAGAHHEKLDGTGYPHSLSASQLSLEARIIAVADVYAALSEDRPYRPALDLGQITAIMRKDIPHKLDPQCFEALLSALP